MADPNDISRNYQDHGYVTALDLFSQTEIEGYRQCFDEFEAREGKENCQIGLQARHLDEEFIWRMASDSRIIDLMASIMGEDILLLSTHFFCKYPDPDGAKFVAWHQDVTYWGLEPPEAHTAWIAIDDSDVENGCMQIVRGSHKLGLLDHMVDGAFTGACQESDRRSDPGLIANITPKAGGISIHHCLALHGSEPNLSGRPRRGLVFQYRADDAYQLADNVFKDTGILVSGQRRERVRCEEGVFRLPKRPANQHPFGAAWNQDGDVAKLRDYDFDADVQ